MSGGLTLQQAACLAAIKRLTTQENVSPSYRELRDALGLSGVGNVHRLVNALQERGYVAFQYGSARSIRVIDPSRRPIPQMPPLDGYDAHYLLAFRKEIDARLLSMGVKP